MTCIIRAAIGVVLSVVMASTASAAIQSGVTKLFPPPLGSSSDFFNPNTVEHDNVKETGVLSGVLLGFDEQENVMLPANLSVDVLSNGMGGEAGSGVLAAGTKVCSHYIFFDPKNQSSVSATITFDQEVLAIITSTANLDTSDFLGVEGLTYNTTELPFPYLIGLGLESGDDASITGTHTIRVNLITASGDFLRVLTNCEPIIPEPTAFVIWSFLGAIGMGIGLRRKRHFGMTKRR